MPEPPPPPPPPGSSPLPPPPTVSQPPPPTGSQPPPPRLAPLFPPGEQATRGLRTATVVLAWCTVAATVLVTVAMIRRKLAWDDLDAGDGVFEDIVRVDDADDLVAAAWLVTAALGLATLIVLSIWSVRVARRARHQGAADVSSGLACGGWYIPYASAIVPFIQLRRMARHWGRHPGAVNMWQGFTIASWVLASAVQGLEPGDDDSFDDITSMLTAQQFVVVLLVLSTAAMGYALTRTLRTLDPD